MAGGKQIKNIKLTQESEGKWIFAEEA